MLQTRRSYGGMVTAPHHLAAEAGARVLAEGGNAIEAMVAAAATIIVAYPHMNALGGDNFWLIHTPGQPVKGIDACGAAAADVSGYEDLSAIPSRGPRAALTVAGAVSGWQAALRASAAMGGTLPLGRLLEDAIHHAENGVAVTETLAMNIAGKRAELQDVSGFADVYLPGGEALPFGARLTQPRIAQTLRKLAANGLDDFYRGEIARSVAADLARAGSPLSAEDLAAHKALEPEPLKLNVAGHEVYNMPPADTGDRLAHASGRV